MRNLYIDMEIADPRLAADFDHYEVKYDGWWCEVVVLDGVASVTGQNGRQIASVDVPLSGHWCFRGEWMIGTQRASRDPNQLYIFDCTIADGQRLHGGLRYRLSRIPYCLPAGWVRARQVTLSDWPRLMEQGEEGIVAKRSDGATDQVFARVKRASTWDAVVVGVCRSRQGICSIVGQLANGKTVRCAGIPREQIAGIAMGRWFEIKAMEKTESGSLRHPTFLRWRDDKAPGTQEEA